MASMFANRFKGIADRLQLVARYSHVDNVPSLSFRPCLFNLPDRAYGDPRFRQTGIAHRTLLLDRRPLYAV